MGGTHQDWGGTHPDPFNQSAPTIKNMGNQTGIDLLVEHRNGQGCRHPREGVKHPEEGLTHGRINRRVDSRTTPPSE